MTVLSDPVDQASDGDGITTAFVYAGRLDRPSDIFCKIIGVEGVERIPTFTTTVGAADPDTGSYNGATVTITSGAPLVGETVIRWRETALRQTINYDAGDFPSAAHERTADKLIMTAQERKTVEVRSLRMARGSGPIPEIAPFQAAGTALISKAGGGFEEGPSTTEISNAQAASEIAVAARDLAGAFAEQAATAAAADTMLFFVDETDTSARVVIASRAVITDPGPGPYPSVTIEVS